MSAIPKLPSQSLIDAAREWLEETRIEEAVRHPYEYDNGDRLRRIIKAYNASDATEAGQVLFDIIDAHKRVDDDTAQELACRWLENAQ